MLKYLPFIISLVSCLSSQAQDSSNTHNGRILDSTTLLPIPFAHIRIKESIYISNQHGDFSFNYRETDLTFEVIISCIGYKKYVITIETLRKFSTVKLIPDAVILNEVVISELSPQSIFRKAEKRGFKNYSTPRYSADYTVEQLIFYENTDSLLAAFKESGIVLSRGLDTTGVYPNFITQGSETSNQFSKYDTIPNQLTSLTNQRNTVSKELLFTYDPVRVGLLKQFHPIPAMFSKGFYDNTEQRILSIVNLDGKEHYLIGVYPKTIEGEAKSTKDELKQIALYRQKIKELAILNGRVLSESALDSIFSTRDKSKTQSYYILGFFLINVKNFGISHSLIKVNTFDQSGKLYAKLHIAASYIESGESYYLQSLDVLMKRTTPPNSNRGESLYYLLTLKLSNFKLKDTRRLISDKSKITTKLSDQLISNFSLSDINFFLIPAKNCSSCKNNSLKYFNQSF